MTYDFERGAKVTGSKFCFMTGDTAVREWELLTEMLQFHRDRGYTMVLPPFLVNYETAAQAGIHERFQGDYYQLLTDEYMLIPTAETPLVGMHSGEIFEEADLPIKYVAYSPCFRREAGSGGRKEHKRKRLHQFNKVELFTICTPEQSEKLHFEMVDHVELMIDTLYPHLEYRRVLLPEHDRSPVSIKTFDIELKVENEWHEVSSISNTGDNQSKPALIRYRKTGAKKGIDKPIKCHLLNGSGLATPRLTMALDALNGNV